MWSTVELREIRVFLSLCEELHFGRTAERVQLTPSRVSQIIRQLEQKVGGRLVDRNSRRVRLTELGVRFREEVGGDYEQLAGTLARMRALNDDHRPPLRLGLFSDPTASRIPRIVKAFEMAHGTPVEAAEVPFDEPFGPLHRGESDLVASWLPLGQRGLVLGPILSHETRVFAVSTDHPLAARTEASVEDLADHLVMRWDTMPEEFHEVWIPSMTPSGRAIRQRPFSDQSLGDRGRLTSELLYLIATGRVVHPTVPSFANMFGDPNVVYIPVPDMTPLCSGLVWLHGNEDRRVQEFAAVAREVVGAIPAAEE